MDVLECVAHSVGVGTGCAVTAVCIKDVYNMTLAVVTLSQNTYQRIAFCRLFMGLIVREVIRATRNAFTITLILFTPGKRLSELLGQLLASQYLFNPL